jgi:hypothetical protein
MENPIMNEAFKNAIVEATRKASADADACGLPQAYIESQAAPAVPETRTLHLGSKERRVCREL